MIIFYKKTIFFYVAFLRSDIRINQNPELVIINVVFLKLHNYIAKNLQSINSHWNDERIFKEARRISIAMYQHVITSEYLPVLLGPQITSLYKLYPTSQGYANGYNPNLNGQTLASYSAAAGRGGHSNVVGYLRYNGPNGRPASYNLRDKFFNNGFLLENNMYSNIFQEYINQACSRQDQFTTDQLNNYMLHEIGDNFGFDLGAVDIDRGRDYGLPPYNKFREACGLCKLNNFDELAKDIRYPEDVENLKTIYRSVDDMDFYLGGLMEKPLPDGTVGQSFACIQAESFYRWKFGDRLFYEFPTARFTQAQLQTIKQTTWSSLLCLVNTFLRSIQRNGFLLESYSNPSVYCRDLPKPNLNLWRER